MPISSKRPKLSLAARIAAATAQQGDAKYLTTPTSCTCMGFRVHKKPCKHMQELTSEPIPPENRDEDEARVQAMREFF